MSAQRMLFGQEVRIVGPGAVEHRARCDDQPLDLGGRAGVHHVKASDRLELVVHLEVGRRLGSERGVDDGLGSLLGEHLGDAAVGGGLRQIDVVEAHERIEPEGAAFIQTDNSQAGRLLQQTPDEGTPQIGAEPGDCDDAR
jgi:hypothetical protein